MGLAGGVNPYGYVPNPVSFVDPLGLAGCSGAAPKYEYDMVNNPGPLAQTLNPRHAPAANFAGGKYNSKILNEDLILYRGGNGGGKRNALGQWFTESPPISVAHVRIDAAVKPQWFNEVGVLTGKSPINAVYKVKIPKGTTIFEGPVGYQGGVYLGGQGKLQIFVKEPWNIKGISVLEDWPLR